MSHLRLAALEALTGCSLKEDSGPLVRSVLRPQDLVNIVSLKQLYKQEGKQEMEYPSLGSLSLRDEVDCGRHQTPVLINPEAFFHKKYDYDFTNIQDGDRQFRRGGERYGRPCGWKRFALNVSQKYDNGSDVWLGTGATSWPVSYHVLRRMDNSPGTNTESQADARPLQENPVRIVDFSSEGQKEVAQVPRGVYCTPDVHLAERYCKTFWSSNGHEYKVLLQNRINPAYRVCQGDRVWVVPIPKNHNEFETRALVQESVRPYGLLIKLA